MNKLEHSKTNSRSNSITQLVVVMFCSSPHPIMQNIHKKKIGKQVKNVNSQNNGLDLLLKSN